MNPEAQHPPHTHHPQPRKHPTRRHPTHPKEEHHPHPKARPRGTHDGKRPRARDEGTRSESGNGMGEHGGTRQDGASANAREEGAHRREHGRTNGQRPPVRRHPRDAHPRGHTPHGIRGHAEVPSTLEHTPAGGACLQWVQGFLCTYLGECLPPMGYVHGSPLGWVRARSAPAGRLASLLPTGVTYARPPPLSSLQRGVFPPGVRSP